MQTKNLCDLITSELRLRFVPWNRFKLSSKIFYWPFQGGTSFVDLLWFFWLVCCYAFVRICLFVPWCLSVSLSLSHWYPGSGVVLDCIDSWSLHPDLLCGHRLGKGWPLGSPLWCLTVILSLSHWYPGSGVVLDGIDSWSLHPNLLVSTIFVCLEAALSLSIFLWKLTNVSLNYDDL